MGKYTGSPWGSIRGKVDDAVGGVWKGIKWLRVRVLPAQPGTVVRYKAWKDDPTIPMSFKQFNLKRLITQVLGFIARFNPNLTDWIRPVWGDLVARRGWTMTGTNAFVKRNAAVLFASLPNQDQEYNPSTNAPDLTKLLVSDGDLEGVASISSAAYDDTTGDLDITWDASVNENGAADDILQVIVAKKPLLEMEDEPDMKLWNWYPNLHLYIFMATAVIRSAGMATLSLPTELTDTDMTAYIFFRDDAGTIGYSPSKAKALGA